MRSRNPHYADNYSIVDCNRQEEIPKADVYIVDEYDESVHI